MSQLTWTRERERNALFRGGDAVFGSQGREGDTMVCGELERGKWEEKWEEEGKEERKVRCKEQKGTDSAECGGPLSATTRTRVRERWEERETLRPSLLPFPIHPSLYFGSHCPLITYRKSVRVK